VAQFDKFKKDGIGGICPDLLNRDRQRNVALVWVSRSDPANRTHMKEED
jgi:hypothetical protein